MSNFVYFFQRHGILTVLAHFGIGLVLTATLTIAGVICDRLEVLGGYAARIFLWQFYCLWWIVRSNFIEGYADGVPVYAGLPFFFVWIYRNRERNSNI